jgi:hypothetical protein
MAAKQQVRKNGTDTFINKWFAANNNRLRLILILTCIVCYGNTIFNDYSLDDDFAVNGNAYVQQGIAGIPGILTHNYLNVNGKTADYRPLVGITFALEKQFFGTSPHVSHFVNMLLFTICVLVIFSVLTGVFSLQKLHPLIPFIITAIYAVHPIHTEVVASIKNRDEILSLIFTLLLMEYTYRFFASPGKKVQHLLLIALCLALALAAKVTSLLIVPVILLMCIFYNFHKGKKAVFYTFSALLVFLPALYFALVMHSLHRPTFFSENPLNDLNDYSIQLATGFEILLFYLRMLLVPYPLSFYYGYNTIPVIQLGSLTAAFSILFNGLLFLGSFLMFRRKQIAGYFILSYGLGILFYSNLIFLYPGMVSERALFVCSLWMIAAIVIALFHIGNFAKASADMFRQRAILAIGALAFVCYTWGTIQRNFEWKNVITLMSADIGHLSNSVLANYFYAGNLQSIGESSGDTTRPYYLNQAKKYYRQAITVFPGYPETYFKLGMIEEYDEHLPNDSFTKYFSKAYFLDTSSTTAAFQLGKSYFLKRDYKAANKLFKELTIKLHTDTITYFFYAQSLYFSGDTARAEVVNDTLMKFAANANYPYLNRGMFNVFKGNMPSAEPDLLTAIKLGCHDIQVQNILLNYYLQTHQDDKVQIIQQYMRR